MRDPRARILLVGSALTLLGVSAASLSPARANDAQQWRTNAAGDIRVPPGPVVNDDLKAAGRNVDVAARVNGEVAVAGADITVSGPVQQDVLAAGRHVRITGPVGDDLRAAGANVTVTAPVSRNASLAGGDVTLTPEASVGRNASILGGSVQIQGPVKRNLDVSAREARLSSEIGGSVRAKADRLDLLPGTIIHGDLVVSGPTPPRISPQARVLGQVDYYKMPGSRSQGWAGWWGWLRGWLVQFLSLMLLGSALLLLARPWADRVVETMARRAGPSVLAGVLEMLLVPLASVLLFLTFIGAPLGILLLTLFGAALLLAGVFSSYLLGGRVLGRASRVAPGSPTRPQVSPYARLALGALIVSFGTTLPVIGWLVLLVVLIVGLGGVTLREWDVLTQQRHGDVTTAAKAPA